MSYWKVGLLLTAGFVFAVFFFAAVSQEHGRYESCQEKCRPYLVSHQQGMEYCVCDTTKRVVE